MIVVFAFVQVFVCAVFEKYGWIGGENGGNGVFARRCIWSYRFLRRVLVVNFFFLPV